MEEQGVGFDLAAVAWLILGFFWYQIVAHVGVSMGLHRYFAHRQFKMPVTLEYIALFLCTVVGARSPIGWVAAHRMHHAYRDTKTDPHAPIHKGGLKVLMSLWTVKEIPIRFSRDLYGVPSLVFFHSNWQWIWLGWAGLNLALGLPFFLAFTVLPTALAHCGFGFVNLFCHRGGLVRDVPLLNLLSAGEGFHVAHHRDTQTWRYHKYDITGALIHLFMTVGWIH